ncbi:hypothetical protein LINGRAHAP2_LOCUS5181 [Linum grandiflorum]
MWAKMPQNIVLSKYIYSKMGEVWARNRCLNFDKYYSASKILDENLTNVPPGFSEAQWGAFMKMRTEDDNKVKVAKNQVNKKMQKRNHAGGSRHYSRYFEELEKDTGKVPSRGEVWRRANKRVDGSWEDPAAEAMENRIQYYEEEGVPREEGYGDSYSLARRDWNQNSKESILGEWLLRVDLLHHQSSIAILQVEFQTPPVHMRNLLSPVQT